MSSAYREGTEGHVQGTLRTTPSTMRSMKSARSVVRPVAVVQHAARVLGYHQPCRSVTVRCPAPPPHDAGITTALTRSCAFRSSAFSSCHETSPFGNKTGNGCSSFSLPRSPIC